MNWLALGPLSPAVPSTLYTKLGFFSVGTGDPNEVLILGLCPLRHLPFPETYFLNPGQQYNPKPEASWDEGRPHGLGFQAELKIQ